MFDSTTELPTILFGIIKTQPRCHLSTETKSKPTWMHSLDWLRLQQPLETCSKSILFHGISLLLSRLGPVHSHYPTLIRAFPFGHFSCEEDCVRYSVITYVLKKRGEFCILVIRILISYWILYVVRGKLNNLFLHMPKKGLCDLFLSVFYLCHFHFDLTTLPLLIVHFFYKSVNFDLFQLAKPVCK